MITVKNLILFTLVFLLMGCSDQKNVDDDQQDIVLTNTVDTGELMTIDGNLERGRKLYLQCRACHSLKENEPHKIGPNLFKIIGSKAGSMKGYNYSDALSKSEIVWTIENLDLWLEKPYEIIPGNKMVFSGMRKQEDRNDLIAYVYDQTSEK
jgi:cytochrome c|tara:strand:+ start:1508 stop:1963 length:456 start_codon:yes stop_codon:yes gene_type:complete